MKNQTDELQQKLNLLRYVNGYIFDTLGDPLNIRDVSTKFFDDVTLSNLKELALVIKSIHRDILEEIRGYPKSWNAALREEVKSKFGKELAAWFYRRRGLV